MSDAPLSPCGNASADAHAAPSAFVCDGGPGGTPGHPRVFLAPNTQGVVNCPWCGRRFGPDVAEGSRTGRAA